MVPIMFCTFLEILRLKIFQEKIRYKYYLTAAFKFICQ